MKITNPAAKRYLREVRSLLPAGRTKRQLMEQITSSVQSYLEQEPDADSAALQARLGEPHAIAAAYVENMGTAKVLDKLRIHKRVMTAVIAGILVALLAWAGVVTWAVVDARNSAQGYIEVGIE